jgi:hypothetical protein
MNILSKVLAFSGIILTSTSCAATPDVSQTRNEAVLLNSDQSNIREAIRVFVRQDAGRFVNADPDSLAVSPNMVVHRRARDFQADMRTLPAANLDYRLVSDGANCWLIRHETTLDSPIAAELRLPDSAQCRIVAR